MSEKIKIAVDAMGGDGSPKKVIDGIIYNHQSNKNIFYKIFGDKNKISPLIENKINKEFYEIFHTENSRDWAEESKRALVHCAANKSSKSEA